MKEINKKLDQIIQASSFLNSNDFVIQNIKNKDKDIVELYEKISILLEKNHDLSVQSEKVQQRFQGVLDAMLDALIIIDDKGNIQSTNIAIEKIFGYKEELVGENIKILMPEPYHFDYGDYLKAYKNREADKSIGSGREINAKRKDGTVFPASLAVGKVIINGNIFSQKLSEI